ncbi:MAG: ATP-grasp domain-containing protein [Candidatus Omnitrophota bacterium]
MKILVTAVGGDLGQSIVKTLLLSRIASEIIGSDINSGGSGANFVGRFHPLPPATKALAYKKTLNNLCRKKKVDIVIPSSEIEIWTLSKMFPRLVLPCGTKILVQQFSWLSIYGDKLKCMRALLGKIDLHAFTDGSNKEDVARLVKKTGFPLVVKPRQLSGSRSIYIAKNRKELDFFVKKVHSPIVQEYLDDSGGEFSVGAFVCDRFTELISFKRRLGSVGCTWFAELDQDQDVLAYSQKLARLARLRGAANFQLRKTTKGVRLLEINPRFSSLVAARAMAGFTDLEWSIRDRFQLPLVKPIRPYRAMRFQRFFHELVDFGKGYRPQFDFNQKGVLSLL